MSLGPVELIVLSFPGNQFKGEILPALKDLVDTETIRVIDILFVNKDKSGAVMVTELTDLGDEQYASFDPLISDIEGLLSDEDALQIADLLEDNSSAALMLFENTWATRFRDAVQNAAGELVVSMRLPQAVIDETKQASASKA